jgi:hypothetical protein
MPERTLRFYLLKISYCVLILNTIPKFNEKVQAKYLRCKRRKRSRVANAVAESFEDFKKFRQVIPQVQDVMELSLNQSISLIDQLSSVQLTMQSQARVRNLYLVSYKKACIEKSKLKLSLDPIFADLFLDLKPNPMNIGNEFLPNIEALNLMEVSMIKSALRRTYTEDRLRISQHKGPYFMWTAAYKVWVSPGGSSVMYVRKGETVDKARLILTSSELKNCSIIHIYSSTNEVLIAAESKVEGFESLSSILCIAQLDVLINNQSMKVHCQRICSLIHNSIASTFRIYKRTIFVKKSTDLIYKCNIKDGDIIVQKDIKLSSLYNPANRSELNYENGSYQLANRIIKYMAANDTHFIFGYLDETKKSFVTLGHAPNSRGTSCILDKVYSHRELTLKCLSVGGTLLGLTLLKHPFQYRLCAARRDGSLHWLTEKYSLLFCDVLSPSATLAVHWDQMALVLRIWAIDIESGGGRRSPSARLSLLKYRLR